MNITVQPLLPTGNYLNVRIGIDRDIPDTADKEAVIQEIFNLWDIVLEAHERRYPKMYKEGRPLYEFYHGEEQPKERQVDKPSSKQEMIDKMIADIKACTVLPKEQNGLLSFEGIVKSTPELQPAYNETMIKLTNKKD